MQTDRYRDRQRQRNFYDILYREERVDTEGGRHMQRGRETD